MSGPESYDLVVMGSGSAGLMAALTAASEGLSVLILEKADKIGGTTAWSGGAIWAPANHLAAAAGIEDSAEEACAYLLATAPEDQAVSDAARLAAFGTNAGPALALIEARTPLRFELLPDSDLFPEAPGAKAYGRMVTPRLLRRRVLEAGHRRRLRRFKLPLLFTFSEIAQCDPMTGPVRRQLRFLPRAVKRLLSGERGMGAALVIGLLRGCLDAGCHVLTGARVTGLEQDEKGRVTAALAERQGRPVRFAAFYGVVIASGGFEWDRDLVARHFPGPLDSPASPPTNEGDGLRIAVRAGAALARMDQANFNSAIPGVLDGRPQALGWFYHSAANAVIVNPQGRRFCDEHDHNLGLFLDRRGADGLPTDLPAWFITDQRFLSRNLIARFFARNAQGWITRAPDLASLAVRIGLDPGVLPQTVQEFNEAFAHNQPDTFGRIRREAIETPPFVALPFNRTLISTKGGPMTDIQARVLRADGSVIDGLYCAGVAMANPLGTKAVSSGTTLGPNLTWGYIAGRDAARRKRQGAEPSGT